MTSIDTMGRFFGRSTRRDRSHFEEGCELRCGLKLRNRVEVLERAGERIGETPCRPRSEFFD